MLHLSTLLKHYKRNDIQKALVEHVADREVAARFGDSFGWRPDVLRYPNDVMEHAKKGATSFHCSEERWLNPLQISTGMKQHELNSLRKAWDLVIDVDSKDWKYAKLISYLVVKVLENFGITSVSVKFSGNKGFHIGVPFEAFPEKVHGKNTSELFPDGPRRIAQYIIHLLENKAHTEFDLTDYTYNACEKCSQKESEPFFICPSCNFSKKSSASYLTCEKCKKIMHKQEGCSNCGGNKFIKKFDVARVLEIDTLLISSRHLYRCPYSLHEKSGLVSLPIPTNRIMDFDRNEAMPEKIVPKLNFLDRNARKNEAALLFLQAFDYAPKQQSVERKEVEIPAEAIPEECFPECIKQLSKGMQDGRKRTLFILINFLRSVGWPYEKVEEYVYEWNKKNSEQLRENYLVGQLRYAKANKPILPPNCNNMAYYQSMGVNCASCRARNPVFYAKKMARGKK